MTMQSNFCNYIKTVRKAEKMTLSALSAELQISRSQLQEILRGNANPRMDTIEHIARRLDIDPIQLLTCSYAEEQLRVAVPLLHLIEQCSLGITKQKRCIFIDLLDKMLALFEE